MRSVAQSVANWSSTALSASSASIRRDVEQVGAPTFSFFCSAFPAGFFLFLRWFSAGGWLGTPNAQLPLASWLNLLVPLVSWLNLLVECREVPAAGSKCV